MVKKGKKKEKDTEKKENCKTCKGNGKILEPHKKGVRKIVTCHTCFGTGKKLNEV